MIDSHCHFDFEAFDEQRESVLSQCVDAGVDGLIIPGVEPEQWFDLVALRDSYGSNLCSLYIAAGVHPWWVELLSISAIELKQQLLDFIGRHPVVAIGECGLDGKRPLSVSEQIPFLEVQVEVAVEHQLPLILHGYGAHNELLQILGRYRPEAGGVIHGFSGSRQLAEQYWKLGFYIGVGGTITYERARKTRNAIKELPLEALLLETDAPDMPLSGEQGLDNTPLNLPAIASELAHIKGESVDTVVRQIALNTRQLFRISPN